ncbi:hypothetical protein C7B76_27545 [filamentous cyanobacterium CCP2]|nr:hypothetical protein C7B76_27545 [filamentous cyanobacterium CCP2]
MHFPLHFTSTDRVIARLRSEGWVDCLSAGFPALSQQPLPDLQQFVLIQLYLREGRISKTDLEMNTLIFSIPAHEFQVHPRLRSALSQLKTKRLIEIQKSGFIQIV